MIGRRAFFETVRWQRQFRPVGPSRAMPGSSGRPAFDALHQMRGEVELAKFQLCAKMDPFGEAQYPSRFPLGAQLALSDWRAA
jgi:hypothetical protein